METLEIFVENIKCGGCMSGIKKAIGEFPGVKSVDINLEEEKITIQGKHLDRESYVKKMDDMGYPEKGNNTFLKEAKSYVSCAIGKATA
jgi:copper chaperone